MSIEQVLKQRKIAFYTLGCKVNLYETEVMMNDARRFGAEIVPFESDADVYVINTCSVTNIADRKSRQILHRAKKQNEHAVIVACGCYAEAEDRQALHETGADLILGNEEKKRFAEMLSLYLSGNALPESVPIAEVKTYVGEPVGADVVRTRADLKVQDGCNQFCSYCIIPYVRGRVRSKPVEECVREAREMASHGVREIVVSGIHLSSYGVDFRNESGRSVTLSDLLTALHSVDGIERIRLGSLEPRIMTEAFVQEIARLPKLCPHFHLSLQSGSASTLRRMNRHYTPDEFAECCAVLRKYFDDPALTTDVITGFPGETEEEFQESLAFVRSIGFYELHVFPFSLRKGTAAARMQDQIAPDVKKRRAEIMIEAGKELTAAYLSRRPGTAAEVLTEEVGPSGAAEGYTREYVRVSVPGGELNAVYRGTIETAADGTLILRDGALVSNENL